uniref:Uncharacterized protein n=1 Tax=Anguilla anguilla TaxID=7936 RepID=A0A0E9P756_ANGAN
MRHQMQSTHAVSLHSAAYDKDGHAINN